MKTYISTSSNHLTFIRTFLAVVGGMAQSSQAPPCLRIEELTEPNAAMSTQWFIQGRWWKCWSPVLPAVIKEMLPAGMDGTGRWTQEEMDKAFSASCRGSMEESFVKEPGITPETYAKTITKTSKAFIHAWDIACRSSIAVQGRRVPGPELEQLLNDRFMEKGLFQLLNDRIVDWATRLQKACADNHETTLEQLIRGQSPRWWAWSLSHGFHGGRFVNGRPESQLRGVKEIREVTETFAQAWTASSAIEVLLNITDLCNAHAHCLVVADYDA